jgi:uncharacterized membrane protein YkoI
MRSKLLVPLLISCGLTITLPTEANEATNAVPLSSTPSVVQKTIQAQTGSGQSGGIYPETNGEEIAYDVELTAKDGTERDFTVDADGKLLNTEMTVAETPVPVQKAITKILADGELEAISKNLDDAEITFDIALTTKTGQEKNFTLADDGTLLSAEVQLNETPEVVQKAIAKQIAAGELESIEKNFDDDGVTYDVAWTSKGGAEKSFTLAADGKLSSVQVTLAETPPPVQRTIKTRLGDGKVLSIDRSFTKRQGIFPYEIEGSKDGKAFDFFVGPRGRFLGMEE